MVVTVRSLGLSGIAGYEVSVECFLSGGLPAFDIVGLPDAAVREARERVRAAVKNCGAKFPVSRITVNLAPAGQKKAGTVYDLPILVGLLAAGRELPPPSEKAAFIGELSLTGALRGVTGVLPMALAARDAGVEELYVPAENAAEATLAEGLTVYGVPDVETLARHLRGESRLSPAPAWTPEADEAAGPVEQLLGDPADRCEDRHGHQPPRRRVGQQILDRCREQRDLPDHQCSDREHAHEHQACDQPAHRIAHQSIRAERLARLPPEHPR